MASDPSPSTQNEELVKETFTAPSPRVLVQAPSWTPQPVHLKSKYTL